MPEHSPQDMWDRIYVLSLVRSLFESNLDVLEMIRRLAIQLPPEDDALKVRSFARSGGATISEDDAFFVIRTIAERHVGSDIVKRADA